MPESIQIVIGLIVLVGVYLLTQVVVGYRIRRTARAIIKDLERRKAIDPASAAELPYERRSLLHIGLRDFRPKALAALVEGGIVARTEAGRYFLKKRMHELNLG
ncbi:MAG: hypothetical protein MUD16_17670 [Desulfobacterales bacterium]|jgi:hypothetical protein|nr:hypothetical protein [Desulfobacterales bacterium]